MVGDTQIKIFQCLFTAIEYWDKFRDEAMIKQEKGKFFNHKDDGTFFRYPSMKKLIEMFGEEAVTYASYAKDLK